MSKINQKSFIVLAMLVASASVVQANRAIMNPKQPRDMQNPKENDENSEKLKAELRTTPTQSEVMQLLAEDETKTQENSAKKPGPSRPQSSRIDCSKITMQTFQGLLQNPDLMNTEDFSCGVLNLMSHVEKSNDRIKSLESSLHTATTTIKGLESSLQTEMSKTQFLVRELNESISNERDRAIKSENIIARRVLYERTHVETIQKNLTDVLDSSFGQLKEFEDTLKKMEQTVILKATMEEATPYIPEAVFIPQGSSSVVSEQDLQKIEVKLTSLQQFIQDLSTKISHMENGSEEHMNKGIAQIFKTYASLASEIEKETGRATGEESNLKKLITSEIATLAKQIGGLQDRISEEKNRVQVIENRRTADLFEEINRAKAEEARLGQKLKDEMSRAAAAFKRLEHHVDAQLNSSKPYDDELKSFALNTTRRMAEVEEKLKDQIGFERSRAVSVENVLKTHLDNEVQRALSSEKELKKICTEERDRARAVEHELKSAIDVETFRAKGVELSISGQITAEIERAKKEEYQLQEHMKGNTSRILTDIIKEFTRAQSVEKELTEKISRETSRATAAEQTLLENINSEISRASAKEQELSNLIKTHESSTKVADQFKNLIETEAKRARTAETKLETQIQEEITRAKSREEKILETMTEEMAGWKITERNLTQASKDVVRHTRELELEVRKTVMAEVARAVDAENAIKQQIVAEVERAQTVEYSLSQGIAGNYTEISAKVQEIMREVDKDALRLEDISLQISRNLTGDILTLAELFDDKLDDLERNENVRLKKLEEDMKKCCSGSSWRWRSTKGKSSTGSTAGAVLNKIMQAFGAGSEEGQEEESPATPSKKDANKGSTNMRRKDSSKGRSIDNSPVYSTNEYDDDVPAEKAISSQYKNGSSFQTTDVDGHRHHAPANQTVVYVHSQRVAPNDDINNEKLQGDEKVSRKKPLRSMRKESSIENGSSGGSSRNKTSLVSVHSVNSKVSSKFG